MPGALAPWRAALSTKTSRLALTLATLLGVGLAATRGFDALNYFSSLAVALLGAPVAAMAGARAAQHARHAGRLAHSLARAARLGAILAAAPLVVLGLNALRVRNCDLPEGVAFYLAGAGFSLVFAATVGGLAGLATRRGAAGAALALAIWAVWVGRDVARLYFEPPIFAYDAFVGFFSGALYDDLIRLDGRLAFLRADNALLLGALIALAAAAWDAAEGRLRLSRLREAPGRRWAWVVGLTIAWATLFGLRGATGVELGREEIQEALGGHVSGDGVELYYDAATIPEAEARRLLQDQEFRLAQLARALGGPYDHKVSSYVYGTAAQKRALMGARRVFIAKPWLHEVHLTRPAYGAPVVAHELAHVVLGRFAPGPLAVPAAWGVLPHMGLVEGAAEALAWDGGAYTPHVWAAAMQRLGLAPDLGRIMGPEGFWRQAAGNAYTVAGSFVRWLLDTRGARRLQRAYEGADFEAAYGAPLEALVHGWLAFLKETSVPPRALALAKSRYSRKGVLARTCPLEIPRLEADARAAFHSGDYAAGLHLVRQVAAFLPGDPRKELNVVAVLSALARPGDDTHAVAEAARAVTRDAPEDPVLRAAAQALLADALWRAGKPQEAAARYHALLQADPLPMSWDAERTLAVKEAIATSPEREPILGPYLLGDASADGARAYLIGAVADLPGDGLALYLLGRRLFLEADFPEASRVLGLAVRAYDRGGWLPTSAERGASESPPRPQATEAASVRPEALRLAGQAALLAGDLDGAQGWLQRWNAAARTPGGRHRAQDWMARLRWLRERQAGAPRQIPRPL